MSKHINKKKSNPSSIDKMVVRVNMMDADFRKGMGNLLNFKDKVKFVKGGKK